MSSTLWWKIIDSRKKYVFKTVGLTSHSERAFMLEILYFAFHFSFYLLSLLFPLEAVKVVGALRAYPCTQTANLHLLSISRLLGISIFQVGIRCLAFDLQLLASGYSLLNFFFFFWQWFVNFELQEEKCLMSENLLTVKLCLRNKRVRELCAYVRLKNCVRGGTWWQMLLSLQRYNYF